MYVPTAIIQRSTTHLEAGTRVLLTLLGQDRGPWLMGFGKKTQGSQFDE
jgi:hypothetical protein